jgi:hypothetical protein
VKCPNCSANIYYDVDRCQYCGTCQPVKPQHQPSVPPKAGQRGLGGGTIAGKDCPRPAKVEDEAKKAFIIRLTDAPAAAAQRNDMGGDRTRWRCET